jgi:riboflavin transporter FmnP
MTGITRDVMTMGVSGRDTVRLVGTAILAAMVIVFDYTLKYSGLKIPFPWMPFLKFDFTGVPIMISLFMFGLPSAVSTSLAALLGIIARSGELVGATSKALAELSTALGIAAGLRLTGDRGIEDTITKVTSVALGLLSRVVVMSLWNIVVLPNYQGIPYDYVVGLLPMLGVFNAMQGAISALLGYTLYEAYIRRVPS